jgi:hypothetical protein
MRTRRFLLGSLVAIPTAFGQKLGGAVTKVLLPTDTSGRIKQLFQNGFLPIVERDLRSVTVIDTAGNLVASFQLAIPDAAVIGVGAVAVSSQKTIVAAVSAKAADGRFASLLVFTDLSGKLIRIVRTTPFAAGRLVFLPDGGLLGVGREYDDRYGLFEDVEGHNVLRFYSPIGVLQGKALNVDLLRPNKRDLHPLDWFVAPGIDRIGMLDRENLRYVEIDYSGAVIRPLAPLGVDRPARVNGVAVLSNGDRLVSVEYPVKPGDPPSAAFVLYQLRDTPNGQVTRRVVREITPPEGFMGLSVLGVHQGNLVLSTTPVGALVLAPQPLA